MRRVLILLLILVTLVGCAPRVAVDAPSGFAVSFIDVGQADAILVQDGDAAVLIDAGNNDDGEIVIDYLLSRGVTRLALAIGTHPDEDHVGGLDTVLAKVPTDELLIPEKGSDTKTYADVLDMAGRKGVPITYAAVGQSYAVGGFTLEVLAPVRVYDDNNNNSVVARVTYGEVVFLLTGDIESKAERDLVDSGVDLECEVLKAAHHGSDTSSGYVFLRAANPKLVVVSCGAGNSYGHPHDAPLSRFRDVGATLFRTDTMGTVVLTSDGVTISANVEGEASDRAHVESGDENGGGENGLVGDSAVSVAGYIGNVNSRKFHLPTCGSLPAEKNRVAFDSRGAAVDAGYEPCGVCKP
ncbi:MAG: MBL fold metallo-hydrolase [Oscillospiraceae bacterium]|jgi:competence protein ComEC|nr:MBL fold metallo-hydrolase [Oscillospiraceae bacterium]